MILRRRSLDQEQQQQHPTGGILATSMQDGDKRGYKRGYKHKQYLPLTTHSRREWSTVSESYRGLRTRYQQLITLIYTAILASHTILSEGGKRDDGHEEEKKSMDDSDYVISGGETSRESQRRNEEDQHQNQHQHQQQQQPSSMGESVAQWLSSGLIARPTFEMSPSNDSINNNNNKTDRYVNHKSDTLHCRNSYEILIGLIRTNEAARRLASLLLGEDPIDTAVSDPTVTKTKIKTTNKEKWLERLSSEEPGADLFLWTLQEIWPRLLELPTSAHETGCQDKNHERIAISVVVPTFREDGRILASKIRGSLEYATEPHRIEIIIVHVIESKSESENENENERRHGKENDRDRDDDSCEIPSLFTKTIRKHLVSATSVQNNRSTGTMPFSGHPVVRILEYNGGGGRGPCLNFGAKHARGGILAFLHADTRLATYGWDTALAEALTGDSNGRAGTTCCAYSFAIDTSPEVLTVQTKESSDCQKMESQRFSNGYTNDCHQYYPPGLRAVEMTANLRCKMFSMPYGDQCLCLPTAVFRYIGGYPDQCLMEDYELIRLLRMRSVASLAMNRILGSGKERIELLSDYKAICSPRRWQKYGVLFVTYTNSNCVERYSNGKLTPDELFCEYYGTRTPPNRINGDRSPWELGL